MSCLGAFSALRPNWLSSGTSKARTQQPSDELQQPAVSQSKSLHKADSSSACICTGDHDYSAFSKEWDAATLPTYNELGSRQDVMEAIEERIDELSDELRELSLKIHDHPELGFEEKYAHDTMTEFMEKHGFEVTRHYGGLETAWKAELQVGSGGRVLGFNSEMDALPGIGHACGHNLIAVVGIGSALAVASALKRCDISGKVVLLGTPAEEGGNGKVNLIEAGAYKEMDACLMAHPQGGPPKSGGTGPSLAITPVTVEYFGHTAHASGSPWEGQNALDAAVLAYTSVSALRQQIKPTHRVHGIIEGRDWAPNIIPDYAKMRWLVRAPSGQEVDVLIERVINCFNAAALATGCRIEITKSGTTLDLRQNVLLSDEFSAVSSQRYGWKFAPGAAGAAGGSTDFGNVTYELPSLHPCYAIPTKPNGGNHTVLFAEAAATKEAHELTIQIMKALAITGSRVLTDEGFANSVKKSFKDGETTGLRMSQTS